MTDTGKKRYGLIHNTKPAPGTFVPRASIFGDDSDSNDESEQQGKSDWVKKAFQKETEKGANKRQTKVNIQKALDEDPTIFQYDEVYDKMEEKKSESKLAKKDIEKKPKYITALLAQAEQRKHENERRMERQVQKEREAEGEEFKDKESFVTSAYRAKLEEFKKQEEEERYRDQLEALTDVSKQKDLSGFYRHLYRQTVVGDETEEKSVKILDDKGVIMKDENDKEKRENVVEKKYADDAVEVENVNEVKEKSQRLYRKRRASSSSSGSSSSGDNPDADSSLSDSSSSDSEDESSSTNKKSKLDIDSMKEVASSSSTQEIVQETVSLTAACPEENKKESQESQISILPEEEPKPKINIWLKRTVGNVFDEAMARYYARKAARLQGCQ